MAWLGAVLLIGCVAVASGVVEVVENIDMKPIEGAIATDATRWQAIRYAVIPQVQSSFTSYALLRFEINVRGASVMGIVGAGGIGLYLAETIRTYDWDKVAFIILMILITVAVIDFVSSRLRGLLVGARVTTL